MRHIINYRHVKKVSRVIDERCGILSKQLIIGSMVLQGEPYKINGYGRT
jgi:hypothetical protein